MRILESLQDCAPEVGRVLRTVVLDRDTGASRVSVVLVRVPPQYEFPLHIHPNSEDCFFILSGAGEAFSPDQRITISEIAGVWIPPGVPHGLKAGELGVLEIGFQSPPGPTVESVHSSIASARPDRIVAESVTCEPDRSAALHPVFAERQDWKYLDPQYCHLKPAQQFQVTADDSELLVVVVRGAVSLGKSATRIDAIAVIQLKVAESEVLHGLETGTLLLGIRAPVA